MERHNTIKMIYFGGSMVESFVVKAGKGMMIRKKIYSAYAAVVLCIFLIFGCGSTDGGVESGLKSSTESSLETAAEATAEATGSSYKSPEESSVSEEDSAAPEENSAPSPIDEKGAYTSKEDVALYLHTYGRLPENFITKKEAKKLGWPGGGLDEYAWGKCIGGDYFGNYEGTLPESAGREYRECDIDTLHAKKRGGKRLIYSNDGLIYYSPDHYESFELLYPDNEGEEEGEPEKVSREKTEILPGEYDGFYRKLRQGKDVKILVNGDSIGAGSGATEGNSWTDLLKSYVESRYKVSCLVTNISMGGNSSYAGYVRENILNDDVSYDLMIICYGENDGRKTLPAEYEAIIRSAEKKYPSCNIISILESSQREYTKKIKAIEELSQYYDIPTADTIAAFNDSGKKYEELTVDVKHPNDEGYRLYFEELKKIIDTETENDTGVERIERAPLNPEAAEFDSFHYYPVEMLVRKDPLTWSLSLSERVSGIIGLYHPFCPSNGNIIINTDSKVCLIKPMQWTYDFRQDFIYKPGGEVHNAYRQIEISFPSAEMADGFKGIIFTGV